MKTIHTLKQKNLMVVFLFTSVFFTSCATTEKTAKTMQIHGVGVIHKPVIADLDVQNVKVTGTMSGTSKKKLDYLKQQAIADALKKANADVLIEPSFEVLQEVGKITVTVTGFPAVYKNIRTATIDDAEILKYQHSDPGHMQTQNPQARKAITLGGIMLGALLVISMIF